MSFLAGFFSGVERANPVIIPTPLRFGLIALWIAVMVLFYIYRHWLAQMKNPYRLVKVMGIILLIDQIILYGWQFFSGYFNLEMSLPLYHCRIAIPLLILDIVFGIKVLRPIWIYWAALGSIFSMAFMDLYRFDFPHYTNFQFFIAHILLGWVISYVIFVLDYRFDKKGLKVALSVTLIYNIALILINAAFNGTFIASADLSYNYGYVVFAPEPLTTLSLSVPTYLYYLIILVGYEALILLLFGLGRLLNKAGDNHRSPLRASA